MGKKEIAPGIGWPMDKTWIGHTVRLVNGFRVLITKESIKRFMWEYGQWSGNSVSYDIVGLILPGRVVEPIYKDIIDRLNSGKEVILDQTRVQKVGDTYWDVSRTMELRVEWVNKQLDRLQKG